MATGPLKDVIKKRSELILFALLSLVVVLWFDGNNYIHQIDSLFFLNPERRLNDVIYYWKSGETLGLALSETNLVPFYFFQTALIKLFSIFTDPWSSLVLSEMVIYYLTLFLAFSFANLFFGELYRELFPDAQHGTRTRAIVLLVSLFYVINPFTLSTVYWRYMTWSVFWTAFPLLCYFFLKYLQTSKTRYIVYSGLVFITPLGAGFSQVVFITLALGLGLVTLAKYFKGSLHDLQVIKRAAIYAIVFTALIAWVVVPQFLHLSATSSFSRSPFSQSDVQMLEYASQFTTILNILIMQGNYLLYSNFNGFPYSWVDAYHSNPLILAGLAIYPAIFIVSLLFVKKERNKGVKRLVLLSSIVFLAFPLLMKGVAEPISGLGYFLSDAQPTFFRHPYDRFISVIVFLYCIFLMYVLSKGTKLNSRKFVATILSLAILFSALNYPLFTGEVIPQSDRVNLSDTSYLNLSTSMGEQSPSDRILVVPFSVTGEYSYNISGDTNHPNSKSLAYDFLPNASILQFSLSPSERVALEYLLSAIKQNDYEAFTKYLAHLNIGHILLQKDFSQEFNTDDVLTNEAALTSIEFVYQLEKMGILYKSYEDDSVALYSLSQNSSGTGTTGDPLLLLGPYSELPGLPANYSLLSVETDADGAYNLIEAYDNVVVFDQPDIEQYLTQLLAEKQTITPMDTASFTNDEWSVGVVLSEQALYTTRTRSIPGDITGTSDETIGYWSFESESSLDSWTFPSGQIGYRLSNLSVEGNHSLLLQSAGDGGSDDVVTGPELNVHSGEVIQVLTNMRWGNANGTNISIVGYNSVYDKWQLIKYVPTDQQGTKDWNSFRYTTEVPLGVTKIRLELNPGSPDNKEAGKSSVWFDGLAVYDVTNRTYPIRDMTTTVDVGTSGSYHVLMKCLVGPTSGSFLAGIDGVSNEIDTKQNTSRFVWIDVGSFYLEKGENDVAIKNIAGMNAIDEIAVISSDEYEKTQAELGNMLNDKQILIPVNLVNAEYTNANLTYTLSNGVAFSSAEFYGNNSSIRQDFGVPVEGKYQLVLQGNGSVHVTIGDNEYTLEVNGTSLAYSPEMDLGSGSHALSITADANTTIGSIWIYRSDGNTALDDILSKGLTTASILDEKMVNPTLWKVTAESSGPFMYVFPQAYDGSWEAWVYKDGKLIEKVSPIPVYGSVNGFMINASGNVQIELRYLPQTLSEVGLIISASAYALLLGGAILWRFGWGKKFKKGPWSDLFRRFHRNGDKNETVVPDKQEERQR